jgi:hypothetical protein
MLARFIFVSITLFWVTMNVLLWRSEYGQRQSAGDPVPAEMVWGKILNSPDESSLNVIQGGNRVGFVRWQTSVGEAFSKMDEAPAAGIAVKSQIRFEGSVNLREHGGRFRFECRIALASSHDWEELDIRLIQRPYVFEIHSTAAKQTVRFRASDGQDYFERVFKFSDLSNPETLIAQLSWPLAGGTLDGVEVPTSTAPAASASPALQWEASNGTVTIGHEPVRVYRLHTRLMDRYDVTVFVSRAGEILRAELPDGIVLMHDKISSR